MEDIGGLLQVASGLQTMRYTSAAATAIYCYDIVLTLDLEVEYIWSKLSFSLPTLLYIINRYLSLGFFLVLAYDIAGYHGVFSDTYCKLPINFIGYVLSYAAWTGILTLRVCALWRQRKYLVRAIQVLWTCALCANVVTEYLAYREEGATISYNPLARLCTPSSTPRLFKLTPIAPLIYELFLTILTIVKAFDFVGHPSGPSLPLLYRILARDGVIYFMVSTTVTAVNLIAWFSLPDTLLYLICSLYWAMMSTLVSRMVLNLKHAHQRTILEQLGTDGVGGGFSFTSPDQSTYMGASFGMGRDRKAKVELGSGHSISPTCTGYASGSQESKHDCRLEKSV